MADLKTFGISILMIGLFWGVGADLSADEPSVEIIDKTNWKKAEGLVPDALLDWVKKGEITLPVGELNYDITEYTPSYVIEGRTGNVGKYELDAENIVVEAETGKIAKLLMGFPFPKIDPNDPKAAIKIIYNKQYVTYILGFKRLTDFTWWIGRDTGFEREIEILYEDAALTGFPGARKHENPKGIERYSISSVRAPYDLAGTSTLMWRYFSAEQDVTFGYLPAIRRTRRTTPAARSDGVVGSDFALDDILAYGGKIPYFEWELIEKKEALIPFASTEPMGLNISEKGEWTTLCDRPVRYGFHDKEWQGAPWAPLNTTYVKLPVWVLKAKAKDQYYNYGIQYIWVVDDIWGPAYKTINDRTDNFWKLLSVTTAVYKSDDEKVKFTGWADSLIIDSRRNHATIISEVNQDAVITCNAVLDLNDFSLAGFQKFCK